MKFIQPAQQSREWLVTVKKHGLGTFLATNSLPEYVAAVGGVIFRSVLIAGRYTCLLLNASYGVGWESLFDIVIYAARKPAFFTTPQQCWGTLLR